MITLKALNQELVINMKFSYLSNNFLKGVSEVTVMNSDGFAVDDFVMLGEFGSETSEIMEIKTITNATQTIEFETNTKWSHAESTKITVIKYNQVGFFYTPTAIFSADDMIGTWVDVQPDSLHTVQYDTVNSPDYSNPTAGGFGWFVFYNTTTGEKTQYSNPIPYAGFAENTVKAILDNFFSILNNKELKLIDNQRAISWMNEAYTIMCSELNIVNDNFNSELNYEITTSEGLAEYSTPEKFGEMLTVWDDENNCELPYIKASQVNNNENIDKVKSYYLRAGYLGISPTPVGVKVYKMTYTANASTLLDYNDTIDLPNGAYYALKDFMMFRASPKLNKGDGASSYKLFLASIERLKITSHKQNSDNDSWGIAPEANV